MLATFNAILPIFLVIILGYALYHGKVAGDDVWSAVEHLCFYLLLPAIVVKTVSRANLTGVPVGDFLAVTFAAVVGMSLLLLLARPLLAKYYGMPGPTFTSLFQGAARWHGFMALAIIGPLYGEAGVTLCALALGVMVPVIQIFTVVVLSVYGDAEVKPTPLNVLKRIALNPFIWACSLGLIFNATGLPKFIYDVLDLVGGGGLGLALLSVGAGLRLSHAVGAKMLVAVGVLIRLVGMPAIVLFAAWAVGLTGLPRTIAVIAGAVPTASTAYVMARKMGGDAELMANIVTFQTIAAAFTVPLFIFIAENTGKILSQ